MKTFYSMQESPRANRTAQIKKDTNAFLSNGGSVTQCAPEVITKKKRK